MMSTVVSGFFCFCFWVLFFLHSLAVQVWWELEYCN
jgi:hypothetical protein